MRRYLLVPAWAALAAMVAAQGLSFSNQTAAVGLAGTHTPPATAPLQPMFGGAAAADFDRDGWVDVFMVMGGGIPDRLFINDGDGTFTDRAAEWGVDVLHWGTGVAVGDYDNDGWIDLFVVSHGPAESTAVGQHKLYRNQGGTGFVNVAAAAGVTTTSVLDADGFGADFGDMDLDGDLDLMVAGWIPNSGSNKLFRNNGDGTFTDVTTANITANLLSVRGFSPHFVDMNGDRYPEILLVGDYATSRYLRNRGDGTFADATAASGTGLDANGMGQCVADFDGDGLLDWYVTSIAPLEPGPSEESGNMLYINQGHQQYTEVSEAAGVNDGGWGWGAVGVDFDNDGDVDIAENNGWYLEGYVDEQMYLYLNDGDLSFTESALALGVDFQNAHGNGLLCLDPDRDGDLDLLALGTEADVHYFRNDLSGPDTHGLIVRLDAAGQPGIAPDGEGAAVHVTAGGQTKVAAITGGASYLSSSELLAHFGLGAATTADEVRVTWPDGTVRTLADVPADSDLTVTCCAGWKNLEAGLAGPSGEPLLEGAGTLVEGDPISLTLTDGPSWEVAWFVLGLSRWDAAFEGGTLVPTLDITIPIPLDGAGGFVIADTWPADVPAGSQLYVQYWIEATGGWTASNAVSATVP